MREKACSAILILTLSRSDPGSPKYRAITYSVVMTIGKTETITNSNLKDLISLSMPRRRRSQFMYLKLNHLKTKPQN